MKKWVLVRSKKDNLYVLQRKEWEVYNAHSKEMGYIAASELVAESDDRDELVRFKELTEEN